MTSPTVLPTIDKSQKQKINANLCLQKAHLQNLLNPPLQAVTKGSWTQPAIQNTTIAIKEQLIRINLIKQSLLTLNHHQSQQDTINILAIVIDVAVITKVWGLTSVAWSHFIPDDVPLIPDSHRLAVPQHAVTTND